LANVGASCMARAAKVKRIEDPEFQITKQFRMEIIHRKRE